MSSFTRRDLLRTSMAVSAGLALLKPTSRVLGANDEIRLATIGVGGQGSYHTEVFSKIPGVRYVAVCDPDQYLVNARVKFFADKGAQGGRLHRPAETARAQGHRRHHLGHAEPLACPGDGLGLPGGQRCLYRKARLPRDLGRPQDGRGRPQVRPHRPDRHAETLVRGPQSRLRVDSRGQHRQDQVGPRVLLQGARPRHRRGGYSGIVEGTNGPIPVPANIDYNLWCGPADMVPLRRKTLHYVWHWLWNTGCGDIGNQGPHEMDIGRWALGDPGLADAAPSASADASASARSATSARRPTPKSPTSTTNRRR